MTLASRWWWLVPLLLLTFWLGARGLDADDIWDDETYMIRDARVANTPDRIIGHLAAQNPWHVPAYFLMMNPWGRLFDWNPPTLRALALFFGVLAVAWTYRLGRDHIDARVGLVAAAVLGLSAFFIHYLHELRMYTLTVLLASLLLWLYWRIMRAPGRVGVGWWLALLATAALMLYTHYFMALLLAGVGVYHLLLVPKTRRWFIAAGVFALAGLAFVPWLGVMIDIVTQAAEPDEIGGVVHSPQLLGHLAWLFGNGATWPVPLVLGLGLLPLWAWRGRESWRGVRDLWVVVAATVAWVVLAQELVGIMSLNRLRYVLLLWSPLALLVAVAVIYLYDARPARFGRFAAAGLLGAWLIFGFVSSVRSATQLHLTGSVPRFPLHVLMRTMAPIHFPGDHITVVLPDYDQPGRYEHGLNSYRKLEGIAGEAAAIARYADDPDRQQRHLEPIFASIGPGRPYVWVARPPDQTPTMLATVEAWLSQHYAACGPAVFHPDFTVDEWAQSPACCTLRSQPRDPLVTYGEVIDLLGVTVEPADDALAAWIAFGGGHVEPGRYSVALHLLDDLGQRAAQTDFGLPDAEFLCQQHTIPLSDVAPGEYTLHAAVYTWWDGARLPASVIAPNEMVPLDTVTVAP